MEWAMPGDAARGRVVTDGKIAMRTARGAVCAAQAEETDRAEKILY